MANIIIIDGINREELIREIAAEVVMQLKQKPTGEEKLLTPEEAMEMLQCSRNSLTNWAEAGIIERTKIGKRVYFSRNSILSHLPTQD